MIFQPLCQITFLYILHLLLITISYLPLGFTLDIKYLHLLSPNRLHFISIPSNRSLTCIWFNLRYKISVVLMCRCRFLISSFLILFSFSSCWVENLLFGNSPPIMQGAHFSIYLLQAPGFFVGILLLYVYI